MGVVPDQPSPEPNVDPVADSVGPASPAAVHTFVFADLAGYTALTEAHGDEHAADAAAEFCSAMRSLLGEHDAEEVNAIGDALLIRVPDPLAAARLAERAVCDYGARHRALGIRVGIHTGSAVRRGEDWFGSGVNLAARVADVARAGEVLLTQATREALGVSVPARSRGRRSFKNVAEPVEIFELVLDGERSPRALPVDPVCRMAIDPERAAASEIYRGAEYYFCSVRCHTAFGAAPAQYTRSRSVREHRLVSDRARDSAVARLRRAFERGRLDGDELEHRVERAVSARTRGELTTVTHDLPRRLRRRSPFNVVIRWVTRPARHWWRRRF